MKKRLFAAFVCLCMIVSMLPTMAFAEAGVQDSGIVTSASGLCEHHTEHTADCGYTEGTAEIPCSHDTRRDCYTLVTECVHEHTAECYRRKKRVGEHRHPVPAGGSGADGLHPCMQRGKRLYHKDPGLQA